MTDSPGHSPSKIRVLIAEDHELARYGLALALEEEGFDIVGEAQNGLQAVDFGLKLQPDLVLMDLGMPEMDGIKATREIKRHYPHIKVAMLTSHKDEEQVYAALAAGADAYCMKDIKIERLCQVLQLILDGSVWLDPAIARLVMMALPGNEEMQVKSTDSPKHMRKKYNTSLTERELQVLKFIVAGKSNKEIAQLMGVTVHTAKAHVCNIIQKLAVDDRTQVAVKAIQEGLLS